MAELISMRKAYGEALIEVGNTNPDVVVLSADVSNSDHSYMFQERFPERFFNVGIAEQSLIDVAVGFAYAGKIPFANTFAFLFATRALEMIRTHLCFGKANVKLMAAYSGLSDSYDGPTHHSISDIAIMRSLPGMTIVVPSDSVAVQKMLPQVTEWPGPVFFRLCRSEVPVIFDGSYQPEIGRAMQLSEGSDITIFVTGILVDRCQKACEVLRKEGVQVRLVEVHTVKPLDEEYILNAAAETGAVVTVEEHSVIGGLGGAVAELLSERCPVPVRRIGLQDCFAESGPYDELLDHYGMAVQDIVDAAQNAIQAKKSG